MDNVVTIQVRGGSHFIVNQQGQSVATLCGGTYTPGYMKNGKYTPGCWRGKVLATKGRLEGEFVRVTVWNGVWSKPGRGSADIFAKEMMPGRECTMDVQLSIFKQPVRDKINHQPLINSDGTPVTVDTLDLVYEAGTMEFGEHSQKMALDMASRPLNAMDFFSEIPRCKGTHEFDARTAAMKPIWEQRNALAYTPGMQLYGRSVVKDIPQGAVQMNNPPQGYVRPDPATGAVGTTNTGVAYGAAMPMLNTQGVATATTGVPSYLPAGTTQQFQQPQFQQQQTQFQQGVQAPVQQYQQGSTFVPTI